MYSTLLHLSLFSFTNPSFTYIPVSPTPKPLIGE